MERLQNPRIWMSGGGLVALLIVALGWFLFIGPQLSSASELRDQAATTRQTNQQLRLNVRSLEAKSTKLPQYTSSLKMALAALPYDSGLPAFTRELNTQARADGVTVDSVLVSGVSPVEVAAGAASAFSVQVTVQSTGSLQHQLSFVQGIQAGPRRALVSSTQITPGIGSKGNSVDARASFTTQLSIFSVPQTPEKIRQLKKLLAGNLGD